MIILVALVILASPHTALAQQAFSFSNLYSYLDETKILHVLGEVENGSTSPVRQVVVAASFFDSEGNNLGEFRRTAELRVLQPGESSPFEILYLNQESADRVANYTLTATSAPAEGAKDVKLKILSSNSRLDLLGTFYLNALARNDGNMTATNTLMVATLYDGQDRVISIGRALAEAVRGTADVPAGSEAAFGVVVSDKLQTYRATKYSLVVQSDQYVSEEVTFRTSGAGQSSSGGNQTSGCLIATAAFGSEFAPQVQQLREFRDTVAMNTFAGSRFMDAFNAWYYSFSPSVAEYERRSEWARDAVRVAVQPLLLTLDVSTSINDALTTSGISSELAIVATGITASSLIGLLYLSPAALLIGVKKRQLLDSQPLRIILLSAWIAGGLLAMTGAVIPLDEAMSAGTSILVLSSISSAVIFLAYWISRLRTWKSCRY
jgi:hypothetical protein